MSSVKEFDQVSDLEMKRYTDLIYEVAGIRIPEQKKTLLSNRIRRRLRKTGAKGFAAYFKLLKSLKVTDPEWDAFLEEITTHETYLFRDEAQWEWFRTEYLRDITSAARRGERPQSLRIWSAAASTGDEAYTLASCIASGLPAYSQWDIDILGTDIGIGALEEAKSAQFGERAMRLVPDKMTKSYFTKGRDENLWTAKPMLTKMVRFEHHNLLDPLHEKPFDLVILKNVLIYFDKVSKKKVMDNLLTLIAPGGTLIAGAAEGVSNFLNDLKRHQPWLYTKPK